MHRRLSRVENFGFLSAAARFDLLAMLDYPWSVVRN
jgi:hypothetical protein